MKQGNQFYLEVQITDKNNEKLDISSVEKVQFNIDNLTKTYDGTSLDVSFNPENSSFLVYLTEEETFKFGDKVRMDTRILFKNKMIFGSYIKEIDFNKSLKEVNLDV